MSAYKWSPAIREKIRHSQGYQRYMKTQFSGFSLSKPWNSRKYFSHTNLSGKSGKWENNFSDFPCIPEWLGTLILFSEFHCRKFFFFTNIYYLSSTEINLKVIYINVMMHITYFTNKTYCNVTYHFQKKFIKFNRSCPRTEPCGTPHDSSVVSDMNRCQTDSLLRKVRCEPLENIAIRSWGAVISMSRTNKRSNTRTKSASEFTAILTMKTKIITFTFQKPDSMILKRRAVQKLKDVSQFSKVI